MTFTPPPLFIGDKQKTADNSQRLPVAFRAIERYMSNLQIPTGGGGGGYLSLTGPGQTATPGDLTQAGGFTVNSTTQISLTNNSSNAVLVQQSGSGGLNIFSRSATQMYSYAGGLAIVNDTAFGANTGALQLVQNGTGSLNVNERGGHGVNITAGNPSGPLVSGFITLQTGNGGGDLTLSMLNGYLVLSNLPVANPGGTNRVWRNGTVLNIT